MSNFKIITSAPGCNTQKRARSLAKSLRLARKLASEGFPYGGDVLITDDKGNLLHIIPSFEWGEYHG